MDNDIHKHDINEDEYHLPEPEDQNVFGHQQQQNLQRSKRRKILMAVGLIVVTLAGYKLIGFLFGSHTAKAPTSSAVTTVTKTTIPTVTTPVTPPMAEAPSKVVAEPTFTQKTTTFTEPHDTNSNQQIAKVETQIGSMTNNLTDITGKLAQLNERLDEMQALIKQQQAVVAVSPVQKVHVIKIIHHKVRAKPRTRYFIQAIIPGRAWLMTANDQTLTVAWGDKIPGYGKVSSIDPVKGLVVTNKGAIIRFKNE